MTPDDLTGLWRRSLIIRADGSRDTTTRVLWLQSPSGFIDLRQPANPPDFSGVRSLADLSADQCAWLAQQQGFAGKLTYDGACFEWQRKFDYQPESLEADAGTLHWDGDVLVETGRDSPYIEHWHRDLTAPVAPSYSLGLQGDHGGASALLVRVGDVFMFARERRHASPLPSGRTLAECVNDAGTLREKQALLDCEISFGEVRDGFSEVREGALVITASTLPFRVGATLDPSGLTPLRW